MWFKNLTLFEIEPDGLPDEETLAEALAEYPLQDCGALELSRTGWVSPFGPDEEALLHVLDDAAYLTLGVSEKLLPAGVVHQAVGERVQQIEQREGRPVQRKERLALKDAVLQELLPQAFVQTRQVQAIMDFRNHRLLVDSASNKQAERVCDALRHVLGSFPVRPVADQASHLETLSQWLRHGQCEPGFQLGEECDLRESEQGAVVRCRKLELPSEEVNRLLDQGMVAEKLALQWDERLEFVLQNGLVIRRLRFTDQVTEQLDDFEGADLKAELDGMRALQLGELRALLQALEKHFAFG